MKSPQLLMKGLMGWGGRRKGSGRKKTSENRNVSRPEFSKHQPLHITLRVKSGVPSLRRRDIFCDFKVSVGNARLCGLRIVHFSVLSNHIHLLVEASSKRELERVMKSLLISFALKLKRRGFRGVFERRYHLHVLKSRRETRHALRYILFNEEKHRGIRISQVRSIRLSPFQTAHSFQHWAELLEMEFRSPKPVSWPSEILEVRALLTSPQTWLLREGWKGAA